MKAKTYLEKVIILLKKYKTSEERIAFLDGAHFGYKDQLKTLKQK